MASPMSYFRKVKVGTTIDTINTLYPTLDIRIYNNLLTRGICIAIRQNCMNINTMKLSSILGKLQQCSGC